MLRTLIKFIRPALIWIGKVHAPFTHKQVTGEDYYHMRDQIKPGCLILSKTDGELSNLINQGEFKHVALYVGGLEVKHTVEAVGKGCVKTSLVDFVMSKDRVLVLESTKLSQYEKDRVCQVGLTYVKKKTPYDYLLSFKNGAKYCAELVYECVKEVRPNIKLKSAELHGHKFVKPDHFLEDKENWKVVYDSGK